MGNGVDGQCLELLGVFVGNPIRGRELLTEEGGHILNGYSVLARRGKSLAPARYGISAELRAVALENIGKLYVTRLGEFM